MARSDAPRRRIVLVVDDEPHIRHIMEHKLGQAGYDVLLAANGADGFEVARQARPDLVLSDFQMPRRSGLEMAVALRECPDTAEIPVIMLTARGFKINDEERQKTKIVQLLPKPFSPREILGEITSILGRETTSETRAA